jgi:uncharacterized integral membrane protein
MVSIDELKQKYNEMDSVQRQNFWFITVGLILLILLIFSLSDTFSVVGHILKGGSSYVNGTVSGASKIVKKP